MDRLQEKNHLFVQLGCLLGPLLSLAEHPDRYDEQEVAGVKARYFAEFGAFLRSFDSFCDGQPGHRYEIQKDHLSNTLYSIRGGLAEGKDLKALLDTCLPIAEAAIHNVPVPRTSVILEAGSPFTAYRRLLELCHADVLKQLTMLDPYISASIFHRYLANVRPKVQVTLVATEPDKNASKRDKQRWSDFLDISRLFAQERGADKYQLVVHQNLHDRWIVLDEKRIYNLGGSSKDAADRNYFTIAVVEASADNLKNIADHVVTGAEWFGRASPTHK